MDGENKEDLSDNAKFGKVIDALHNKSKLSSLRTYQGDMAEFIKSKNESVISINVKEKERKEERQEKEEVLHPEVKIERQKKEREKGREGFPISASIVALSLVLLVGGGITFFYIYEFLSRKPVVQVEDEHQIIPYNNLLTLANVTNTDLGPELWKLGFQNGVSIVQVTDTNGASFSKYSDFLNFLKISAPSTLLRTLQGDYVLGAITQGDKKSYFLVFSVNDFGQAFTGMLEWEEALVKDLSFLSLSPVAETSTSTKNTFVWRDLIVKNKDTRAYADPGNNARAAYTFLDKNTILITNSISAIGEISSLYASRSVSR